MGFFKKAWNFIARPIKAIVDPVIDFTTNTFKAVISPFTGAFDLPDSSVNFDQTSNAIKAATVVDFAAANRAVPVLYGHKIETATIPVFVGTWGTNSADTTKQYLYMAAVISQGFHGSNGEFNVNFTLGSLLSRITIDGKPVHIGGLSNTGNPNYSQGYDGSTALNLTSSAGGIFASGKGGVQPTQHSITKGTFANRVKIQYFDGSADQPVSSLLNEHPEWSPTGQSKLSGMHYVALRFLIQAADETVGAGDGGGTYGNPYSSIPAVVVTTSGRPLPNVIAGLTSDPGYTERFQTSYTERLIGTSYMTYHKPLGQPEADGLIGGVNDVAKHTEAIESDTIIEMQRFKNFQPTTFEATGNPQTVNIHDILFNLGWTYDWVYFVPGTWNFNSDSTTYPSYDNVGSVSTQDRNQWLKHVGGGHYQFVNKVPVTISTTVASSTLTFFAYNSDVTEAIINNATPSELVGTDSTTAEYRFYATEYICQSITDWYAGSTEMKLRIRDRTTNVNTVYNIDAINSTSISDATTPFVTLGIHNEDSSAVATNFYTTVPAGAEVYVEVLNGSTNTDKTALSWEVSLADNIYLEEGLPYQGYVPDSNPIEMIIDYLLNPNYGVGISVNHLDKKSFVQAAIACDRIPNYYDFDSRIFQMGETALTSVADRNVYMYGENATTGASVSGSAIHTMNNGYDRIFKINTNNTHLTNINIMLASIGATMPVIDGNFYLFLENAGDPEDSESIPPLTSLPITATITDEHVIGAISISTASVNDKFNQIKIDYTNIANNSQPASVISPDPIDDSTSIRVNYLAEDNDKKLEGNFSFPGIYDSVTAQKMATLLLKKSRGNPTINFAASPIAMSCVPGDFVRITSDVLKINDVYRVTAATLNGDHTVGISCIRHIPEFYNVTETGEMFEARRNIMDIK